jgi:hypothetical protein
MEIYLATFYSAVPKCLVSDEITSTLHSLTTKQATGNNQSLLEIAFNDV